MGQLHRKHVPAQLQYTTYSSTDFLKEHKQSAGHSLWTDEETFHLRYVIGTEKNEVKKKFNEMRETLLLCGLPSTLKHHSRLLQNLPY